MQYRRFLRWSVLVGLALVFFLAFIVSGDPLVPNMFFPYITGKNFVFRILIEILFGLYVLLAIREPKYRPKASLLLWATTGLVLWVALATVFSVDPIKSFWSNFERMDGYITTLHLYAYFIMLGAVVVAEEWWEQLFTASVCAGTLQALYSLGQLLHIAGLAPSSQSGARLDGTFGNAIYLAVFMLFNIFLTLLLLLRRRASIGAQVALGIALVLQVLVLYYTETRGALLGMIGGLIIAALYIAWKGRAPEWRTLRKVSMWGLGAIVVVVVLFFAVRNTSFVRNSSTLNRIASISLSDPTTVGRFDIWREALKGAEEKPVLGWGQENFNFVFNKFYNPSMYAQEQWFDRVHNQFLDWLIDAGVPAFLLYISLFCLVAWAIIRSDLNVPEQAILLGLLVGYAFNNLTVFDDLMSGVYFFTLLAFAHGLSRKPLSGWLFMSKPLGDRWVAVVAPIVVVVVVGGAWMLNAPGIARAQNLLTALETQELNSSGQVVAKDPKDNLAEFQVALGENVWPGTPLGQQEVTEQLMQFAATEAADTSINPATLQSIFTETQTAAQAMLTERQHDARLELFMGTFYGAFNQVPQAVGVLQQALADSPTKQQILFQLGVTYLNAGDTNDALTVLAQAYNEAPAYSDARILYASALYYAGNNAQADALLMQGFGTVLVDDSRLLQVYTQTKQWSRVIGIWQNRVKASPNDPQQYLGLAAAYFAEGDKADTIAQLQKAASLDPAIASQVQSLITQINNGTLKPGQ